MKRSIPVRDLILKDLLAQYMIKFLVLNDNFNLISCLSVYGVQNKTYGLLI